LDKKFTLPVLKQILAKRPKALVKPFLLDPKMIAGIGNIYSDEILFYAKIHPLRKIGSLNSAEQVKLFKGIKKVLTDAVRHRGSSVGDFIRPNGDWGTYGKVHMVYGRKGEKCKVCGTIIKSLKFNGRTGSYCPECQK
jgi:formamidopyrimidine-DNA glycosylase